MLKIYNELKADDLEFISVSLDDSQAKWKKMLDEEKLPWVMPVSYTHLMPLPLTAQ